LYTSGISDKVKKGPPISRKTIKDLFDLRRSSLPIVTKRKLDLARGARRGCNIAERSRQYLDVRQTEEVLIEQVEGIHAKLQAVAFPGHVEVLRHTEVELVCLCTLF